MRFLRYKQVVYTLDEELLGEGTFGKVRKATRDDTWDVYACKTVEATRTHKLKAYRVSMVFDLSGQMLTGMC